MREDRVLGLVRTQASRWGSGMAGQRRARGAWSRRLAQPMREPVGTRFLLFPQPPFLEGFEQGEHILVSPPAGTVGPGPSDDRMYAIYPVDKLETYGTLLGP